MLFAPFLIYYISIYGIDFVYVCHSRKEKLHNSEFHSEQATVNDNERDLQTINVPLNESAYKGQCRMSFWQWYEINVAMFTLEEVGGGCSPLGGVELG